MQKGLWKGKYFGSTIFRKLPIVMISIWVLHPFNLSDVPVTCFCDNRIRNLDNKIITDDVSLTLWRGNRHHVEGGGGGNLSMKCKIKRPFKIGVVRELSYQIMFFLLFPFAFSHLFPFNFVLFMLFEWGEGHMPTASFTFATDYHLDEILNPILITRCPF